MRHVLIALALVSCTAEPLPSTGSAPFVCQPYIRCTWNYGHCADMVAFCGCMDIIQDKPNDCVTCYVEGKKPWMPLADSGCYYKAPSK